MPPGASLEDKPAPAFVVFCIGYCWLQIAIARLLAIGDYDTFDNLRNARRLVGGRVDYVPWRPPLIAFVHAPLQKLLDLAGAGMPARIWAPHLLQTLFGIACIAAVYAYFRRCLPRPWAELGAALFALDRPLIHYFCSVMDDIPCTFFLLLFLLALDGARRLSPRREALAACALGACLLCRWNMPVVPFLVLCALWLSREGRRRVDRRLLWSLARISAPGAALLPLVVCLVYLRVYSVAPPTALQRFAESLRGYFAVTNGPISEPIRAYWDGLLACAGVIPFCFAALGALLVALGRISMGSFELSFFSLFVLTLGLVVEHKEIRFLLPVLPLYYFLMICALKYACEHLPKRAWKGWRTVLVLSLAGTCAFSAAKEWARFADPVFRAPLVVQTARAIAKAAPPGQRVDWDGIAHAMAPQGSLYTPEEPLYYLYFVPSRASAEYLLGRPVYPLFQKPEPGDLVVKVSPRWYMPGPWARAEDAIVLEKIGAAGMVK